MAARHPGSVEALVAAAVRRYGGLDVAVNNAGIGGEQHPTGPYSPEGWRRVICFLASDEASFVTGGYYVADDGYTAQ